jgi:hypothetical protein
MSRTLAFKYHSPSVVVGAPDSFQAFQPPSIE